jgi:hypothetical protein
LGQETEDRAADSRNLRRAVLKTSITSLLPDYFCEFEFPKMWN